MTLCMAKAAPFTRLIILPALLLLAICRDSAAQGRPLGPSEFLPEPVLPRDFSIHLERESSEFDALMRPAPLHLFSMPTAIPQNPLGLDTDDDLIDPNAMEATPPEDSRIQVSVGMHNPFFDFRRRGDPGGVGYYKLYSQALLWDSQKTAFSVGLEAMTPAGLDADGVATGPTHICPNFAWLYDLGGGTALHGFVGQNLRAGAHWDDQLVRSLKYGVALQGPPLGSRCDGNRGVHLFVEALGRYRYEDLATPQRPSHNWEILPGVEWRLNQNWWLSGGFLFPMNDATTDNHRVQINCTLRF
jgi:hypothetical protein